MTESEDSWDEYKSMPVPPINPVAVYGIIRGSFHLPKYFLDKVLFYGENRLWEDKYKKPNSLKDGFKVKKVNAEEAQRILHPDTDLNIIGQDELIAMEKKIKKCPKD